MLDEDQLVEIRIGRDWGPDDMRQEVVLNRTFPTPPSPSSRNPTCPDLLILSKPLLTGLLLAVIAEHGKTSP